MGFTIKEKVLSNFSASSVNCGTATRVLRHLWPLINLQNQENVIAILQVVVKAKELEGKYSFINNIIFEIVPTIFLISINILFALFSYLFC